jgi:hypothetical protein
MFLLNGLVGDFTFAARLRGQAEPRMTAWLNAKGVPDSSPGLAHRLPRVRPPKETVGLGISPRRLR